jgi:tRNA-modifying protein YgfZ
MIGGHFQLVELEDLGALRVAGSDAVRFLQGQLSSDVGRASAERSVLAGLHNPQGRTIAVLRIAQLAPDDLLVLLPRELTASVAARLVKYVLRARVKVTDESHRWRIEGLIASSAVDPSLPDAFPTTAGAQHRLGEGLLLCVGEQPRRWLLIRPAAADPRAIEGLPMSTPASRDIWRQLDIIAGLPQIYAATTEEFVAQMLNLDLVGAIAFDKGCYTGQEVIARAHYRGRVKRRLQRFRSRGPLDLRPGDGGELTDGRPFKVVDAVRLEDGRCEFLAVAPLPTVEPDLAAATRSGAMLEQIGAPLGARAAQAGAAALARTHVSASVAGAVPQGPAPADLSTTGAFWAPFATGPGAPPPAASDPLATLASQLPPDIERLELPYTLPD